MRLIDADEMKEVWGQGDEVYNATGIGMAICKAVDAMPTIDAVPVVRCKDCIWWKRAGCAFDTRIEEDIPKENDFCSYGERRADNG